MKRLLLRLDDASEYMDVYKWRKMEELLDRYKVKPLFGIIPANKDANLLKYGKVDNFWDLVHSWIKKGWIPALHGYSHVFESNIGGINPINKKSEYAGIPYEQQLHKIIEGIKILKEHGINAKVFFAPAHTFDDNTIKALINGSDIRIISDTPACDIYWNKGITFIPQQSGRVRHLWFRTVTYCYHPNTTTDEGFEELEKFLKKYRFNEFPVQESSRKKSLFDSIVMKAYYFKRR